MSRKDIFGTLTDQLNAGAFLTVKSGEKTNTMTIGWATEGIAWGKDVMTVMVRFSRYTYDIIKNANSFTVSVPEPGTMKKELGIMGSKSGRDEDKYELTGLKLKESHKVESPVIEGCSAFYECRIIYKQAMDPSSIVDSEGIEERYYAANNDYHVVFYGEILVNSQSKFHSRKGAAINTINNRF